MDMTDETMIVSTTVDAPADTVFAVLADPATHPAIDGTGWVRESLDGQPLRAPAGQSIAAALLASGRRALRPSPVRLPRPRLARSPVRPLRPKRAPSRPPRLLRADCAAVRGAR